jgi:AcrR family transcriptional regulator
MGSTSLLAPPPVDPSLDTAKRRQIMDGARPVFLAQGFEGASMNDIARAAGVSKGTLYVYFESKERLFAAIVEEERYNHVTMIFDFDRDDRDVEAVLMRVGTQLAAFLTEPRIVSAMRVVMGIAERMPELGRRFYESGPCFARAGLAAYLERRVVTGELECSDTGLAAAQFLEMSNGPLAKPMFFGLLEQPSPGRIREVVASAVKVFVAAYGRKA